MVGRSFTVINDNDNIVPQGPSPNSLLRFSVIQRNIETGMLGHFTANADPGNWAYSYRFFLPSTRLASPVVLEQSRHCFCEVIQGIRGGKCP